MTPRANTPQRRATTEEAHALWTQYKATGDEQLRNRLVMAYLPMVQYIVAKKVRELPTRCDVEDFISCGIIGLIGAIDRYDPSKGATLEQFAWTRVQGAVVDELRRLDWAPRSLRRWERESHKARETFLAQHGRHATNADLAALLEVDPDVVQTKQDEIALAEVVSLNCTVSSMDDTQVERMDVIADPDGWADPERAAMGSHGKELFRRAFSALSDREREVAVMLYLNNATLREIGDHLGVSESRVCQMHARIKTKLRKELDSDRDLMTAAG